MLVVLSYGLFLHILLPKHLFLKSFRVVRNSRILHALTATIWLLRIQNHLIVLSIKLGFLINLGPKFSHFFCFGFQFKLIHHPIFKHQLGILLLEGLWIEYWLPLRHDINVKTIHLYDCLCNVRAQLVLVLLIHAEII